MALSYLPEDRYPFIFVSYRCEVALVTIFIASVAKQHHQGCSLGFGIGALAVVDALGKGTEGMPNARREPRH
jgi:hypothetical protein